MDSRPVLMSVSPECPCPSLNTRPVDSVAYVLAQSPGQPVPAVLFIRPRSGNAILSVALGAFLDSVCQHILQNVPKNRVTVLPFLSSPCHSPGAWIISVAPSWFPAGALPLTGHATFLPCVLLHE
jgi:hypothetical protein